jgi:cytochrome P450
MKNLSESDIAQKPVLVNDVMYWFTFDSMGEFAFNQDFGMMKRQEWHYAIHLFRRALSVIGPFASTIWLIKIGFAFFPWFWKIGSWFEMMRFCYKQMDNRVKMEPEEKDIASFFIDEAENQKEDPSRDDWIRGDTATVIVAGRYVHGSPRRHDLTPVFISSLT